MSKYLITGGAGFIGSRLTAQLIAAGHEVIVVDDLSNSQSAHPKAQLIQKDISQFNQIGKCFIGIDGCFHLAAKPLVNIALDDWFTVHATNLQGSFNVFKAAIEAGNIPVVYASSCAVYGNATQLPLTEHQFIQPLCSYGCDKLAVELNGHYLAHDYHLPSIGLRFFNVYGPGQQESSPYSGVITRFITRFIQNKPVIMFGDGEQTRDFIFVDDIVRNAIAAMQNLKQGAHVVNLCSGVPTSINQLAQVISQIFKKSYEIDWQPQRASDVRHSYGSRIKMQEYGFDLKYDLVQGLTQTIGAFLSNQTS